MTKKNDSDKYLEKQLGKVTIQKSKYERELVSTGIRELDEMLGGGFRPGTCTLIQEDLGAGGLMVIEKIIEIQLSLGNKILAIVTDPTAEFFIDRLKELPEQEHNLLFHDFVKESRLNIELLFDKHELSLQVQDAQQQLIQKVKESDDDDIYGFAIYLTLNPFLMNLDERTVNRMLFENVLNTTKNNIITLTLMQKDVISAEYHARIVSMFHAVIDLSSEYKGIQKMNYIRILKYAGRYFDPKIEPYLLEFDVEKNRYNFLIRSAFLNSFDTYRSLMEWQAGSIYLNKVPYILTPISFVSMLMEIPRTMNEKRGTKELIEKGMAIGRILTINTNNLYHLSGVELLKTTVRAAALQGYGYIRVIEFQLDENLLILRQIINPAFNLDAYRAFLEGFYKGIVRRSIRREVRLIQFEKMEMDEESGTKTNEPVYTINIRLDPTEISEELDLTDE